MEGHLGPVRAEALANTGLRGGGEEGDSWAAGKELQPQVEELSAGNWLQGGASQGDKHLAPLPSFRHRASARASRGQTQAAARGQRRPGAAPAGEGRTHGMLCFGFSFGFSTALC